MDKEATEIKEKNLLENLASTNEDTVVDALEDSKHLGTEKAIRPILDVVIKDQWISAKSKALEVLSSLKDEKAIKMFFQLLHDEKYKSHRAQLIAAIWLAGMDARNHIAEIIKTSLEEDFTAVLEALTVLDNIEDEIPEDQIIEAQIACKGYLENAEQDKKYELVETLLKSLNNLDTYN